MNVKRFKNNPIISPINVKPSRKDFEVMCAFNVGVVRYNGEVVLLIRVAEKPINHNDEIALYAYYNGDSEQIEIGELSRNDKSLYFDDPRVICTPTSMFLTSISHLRVARSKDGINFIVSDADGIYPSNYYETYGIEDPRITKIEDVYYINYSAISPIGITTCLAKTKDFINYEKMGPIFLPDNKDVAIFPERINGYYYAINRPATAIFRKNDMWISRSPDLIHWGDHRYLMGASENSWDNGRVGASAVPFEVKNGWIEIYHGATKDDVYCLGVVLLDKNEPWKIISRAKIPLMKPEEKYETHGFFGNVIFNCGVLFENNIVKIYYGAADTFTAYAEIGIDEIVDALIASDVSMKKEID